jgi:hypothetical protein
VEVEDEVGSNNERVWDECVWLDKKSKSKMSDIELHNHFNTELHKMGATTCSNPECGQPLAPIQSATALQSCVTEMPVHPLQGT